MNYQDLYKEKETPYTAKNFRNHITHPIKTVIELGCSVYTYTYDILKAYNPNVLYAFEAHPDSCKYCEENIKDSRIVFVPKAVADHNGTIEFFPFNNITDCSSVFKRIHMRDHQADPISIPCTRLDTFLSSVGCSKVDMLCMDIQGSELNAMKSLGDALQNISYIIMEIPKDGKFMHEGAPTRHDLLSFLSENSFEIVDSVPENDWEDNVLIRNTRIV